MSRFTALEADGGLSLDDLVPNQPVNERNESDPPPTDDGGMNVEGPTG
jgi:hypothetical protein